MKVNEGSVVKKIIFLFFLALQSFIFSNVIETERTEWILWTSEHTQAWEEIESRIPGHSYFRRNDYFETIDELVTRDNNWAKLCNHIYMHYGQHILFPDLGYAIIRKSDQKLIGTIRIKMSNKVGYLSFGYALIPEVHNQKFGQEIIHTFIQLIDEYIGKPMIWFKQDIDRSIFMTAWKTEGKKDFPDLDFLFSFFSPHPESLQGVIASVDAYNQPSLVTLLKNGMRPCVIECEKYIFDDHPNLFTFDFFLEYPSQNSDVATHLEPLLDDILSRDITRIMHAHNTLKTIFNIYDDWDYLQLSRAEKSLLNPVYKITLTTTQLDTIKKMGLKTYIPPYCFVK